MAQPASQLRIRPYDPADRARVLFSISKGVMEGLTVANNRSYVHPITISVWIGIACIFIQVMNWWPHSYQDLGLAAYLSPLPAFAAIAVPVMLFFDWMHRPFFERASEKALRQKDLLRIERTYAHPPSGFYVLEYEGRIIGILGLDAPKTSNEAVEDAPPGRAIIRHFYVTDPQRQSGVQDDLLAHAINVAFSSPSVKSIEASYSTLTPYIRKSLLDHGFKISSAMQKGVVISWEIGVAVLQKSAWVDRRNLKSTI